MTLEDIARLCPAPEGWGNWYPEMDLFDTCVVGYVVEAKDGAAQVRIKDISSSGNAWNVSTFIRYKSSSSWVVETDADLPASYLRALQAVGLAPDAEKEDMRRRLTWTSEVPTEPGGYLVQRLGRMELWSLRWSENQEPSWHQERAGFPSAMRASNAFSSGSRFLSLSNLKETPHG